MSPQNPEVLNLGLPGLDTNPANWPGLQTLLQQLPPQDSSERYCLALGEEELAELRLFCAQRRREALGQGVARLVSPKLEECTCEKVCSTAPFNIPLLPPFALSLLQELASGTLVGKGSLGIDSLTNFRKKGDQVWGFLLEPAVEVGLPRGMERTGCGWGGRAKRNTGRVVLPLTSQHPCLAVQGADEARGIRSVCSPGRRAALLAPGLLCLPGLWPGPDKPHLLLPQWAPVLRPSSRGAAEATLPRL